jgi:hypothetical protein
MFAARNIGPYYCKPYGKGARCVNTVPRLLSHVPLQFDWHDRADLPGLEDYIEAVVQGHRTEQATIEGLGHVTGVQMGPEAPQGESIRVPVRTFLAAMKMQGYLDIPMWSRLRFVSKGDTLVPAEFIAALAEAFPDEGFDPAGTWQHATPKTLAAAGMDPRQVTTSMGAARNDEARGGEDGEGDERPQQGAAQPEVKWSEERGKDTLVLVTKVLAPRPYFTKRVWDLRDGAEVYAGTAWAESGPWKSYRRDNARLIALGVMV